MTKSQLIEILLLENDDAKVVIDTGFECIDINDVITSEDENGFIMLTGMYPKDNDSKEE